MLADLDSAAIASASVSTKFTGIGVSPLYPPKAACAVQWSMSALGQKRTCAVQHGMSALPPRATGKADMCSATRDVCFGPKADNQLWQTLVRSLTNRLHFPHYLIEIEARWLLPRGEFLEALEPRRSECLHRHLNEGAIYHPF